MSFKFKCVCHTTLRAPDGTEGRWTTCPACDLRFRIPPHSGAVEAFSPAPLASEDGGAACPSCGKPVPADAVLCINCGWDSRAGGAAEGTNGASTRRGGPAFVLPTKILAAAAAVLVVLGIGWFAVAAPLLAGLRISHARGYLCNGDLEEAIAEFQKQRATAGAAERERLDLRIAQTRLEMQHNTGQALSSGRQIPSDAAELLVHKKGGSGGALMFSVSVRNQGEQPLTLKEQHFYLRGLSDIVLVASHEDNSVEGVVVPPGERKEGLIAFRKVPDHPVHLRRGRTTDTRYYLMFNDGTLYTKVMLPF